MSAHTDELRATALAPCDHSPDERCEHKDAALAYLAESPLTDEPFPWGAFLAVSALGAAFWIIFALAVYNVARWWA